MKIVPVLSTLILLLSGSAVADQAIMVDSPLGAIVVSCEMADAQSFPFQGVKGTAYVNKKYDFTLSVPNDDRWQIVESPRVATSLFEAPVLILSAKAIDNHKASVSVFVEHVEKTTTIMSYVEASVFQLRKTGRNVMALKIDDETSGGYVESSGKDHGTEVSSVQRFVVHGGLAFVVTGNSLPGQKTPGEMKNDLREIINSFKLLSHASKASCDPVIRYISTIALNNY